MSAHKYIVAVTILIAVVLALNTQSTSGYSSYTFANKSHNLTVGRRMPGDRLILKQNIVKNSSWMKIVIVEKTFNATRNERITLVQALDQKTNGNGAYASIIKGGPGYQNVTLRFKSQRGHGINFIVQLYARP